MIRPSSTPSPPLRAGFPSRARFSSFPSRAFPARRLCPFALPTSSLWHARTHTTHARYTSTIHVAVRDKVHRSLSRYTSIVPRVRGIPRGRCRPEALRVYLSLSLSLLTRHAGSAVTERSLLQPVSSRSQDLTFALLASFLRLRTLPLFTQFLELRLPVPLFFENEVCDDYFCCGGGKRERRRRRRRRRRRSDARSMRSPVSLQLVRARQVLQRSQRLLRCNRRAPRRAGQQYVRRKRRSGASGADRRRRSDARSMRPAFSHEHVHERLLLQRSQRLVRNI